MHEFTLQRQLNQPATFRRERFVSAPALMKHSMPKLSEMSQSDRILVPSMLPFENTWSRQTSHTAGSRHPGGRRNDSPFTVGGKFSASRALKVPNSVTMSWYSSSSTPPMTFQSPANKWTCSLVEF